MKTIGRPSSLAALITSWSRIEPPGSIIASIPFKRDDIIAIRAFANSFIGGNVKMDDAYVDPQYLRIGDNTQIAAGACIHTFEIFRNF